MDSSGTKKIRRSRTNAEHATSDAFARALMGGSTAARAYLQGEITLVPASFKGTIKYNNT